MGDLHRSAQGKTVDMAALRSKNENVRAVGNMNVNTRGDVIDSNGRVISDNSKRVNEYYMQSALSRGIRPGAKNTAGVPLTPEQLMQQPPQRQPIQKQQPKLLADEAPVIELTQEEMEFDAEDSKLELPKKEESEVKFKSDSSKKH